MSQFTSLWLYEQNAKRNKVATTAAGVDRESKLHDQILDYCKMKGWYVVHSRMDRKPTNGIGTPDFIIATREGTLWIEAKRAGSKPRPEQLAANHWLNTLGHKAHFIWSFVDFLKATEGIK